MEKAWTISIIGIIVALGGLGFIAIFFATIGHFFKKTNGNKKKQGTIQKSTTTLKRSASSSLEKKAQNAFLTQKSEDEEIVAVVAAALAAFGSKESRVLSVKHVEPRMIRTNVWKFHETHFVWRTLKRK